MIEFVEPDPANPPAVPLSSAVRVGDLLFVSGQASTDPETGAFVSDTLEGEFRRTLANLERVLAAGGATLHDLVKVNAFLRDEESLAEYNALYAKAMPTPPPARTTSGNTFGFLKIEIDAIAAPGQGARTGS